MDPQNPLNLLPQSTLELLMNPTIKNIGETLGDVAELVLSPVNIFTTWTNTHIRKYKQSIIDNINKIPEGDRDLSKFNLAMKVIDDSKFQITDDNLREMFAKLIAASIDKRNNQGLSPRFSNVLSQFSPEDARFLMQISTSDLHKIPTIIFLVQWDNHSGGLTAGNHFIAPNYSTACWFQNELSLNNLVSLGIINQSDDEYLAADINKSFYDSSEKSNEFLSWSDSVRLSSTNIKPTIKKGYIEFTTFGKKLTQIVIQN
ncbi:DUF4393 domain-containing protein [Lactobacillus sp.]|uniref:DUF4393 domain-containing protein n=1 Tax=Lactobacillus sp. TaxID=1591 RepID=UPI00258DEB19|nr:DUF4393 domain-containing protein [Lactobacillus sp.]MCO6528973.1 DUF4393 domain-containing protein [Lactobacillus sp.]MCO6530572.1 DUF4393 domain-containing protein [Lactobacillus sp.]